MSAVLKVSAVLKARTTPRAIVLRTRGSRHGPITRLASPSDVGELIKPFVFLDLFDISAGNAPNFGWHPHSGIATLTLVQKGAIEYQETTGVKGILAEGGIEWMRAGRGVWHTGAAVQQAKGFQLWIALPEALESAPSQSQYLSADLVPEEKPARVILGAHGDAQSSILAPKRINYLDVQLAAGERWTYQPPPDHDVAWLAVSDGTIGAPEPISAGELAVFEESNDAIVIRADRAARFILGSAAKHPHDLVLGSYSVHTSEAALAAGESEIERIGNQLATAGLLR
ncbi:MAG TPA: pirin family protein [Steroidobacteraceae bacterium]|jgi:redox-sensitive bicupin YhaK (pirin superfamily)|nr:pirin family protein [Steroidobacteraceae bacterium]